MADNEKSRHNHYRSITCTDFCPAWGTGSHKYASITGLMEPDNEQPQQPRPGNMQFAVPTQASGLMLLWGDDSVTTLLDDGPRVDITRAQIDPLLRRLMIERLRYHADALEGNDDGHI